MCIIQNKISTKKRHKSSAAGDIYYDNINMIFYMRDNNEWAPIQSKTYNHYIDILNNKKTSIETIKEILEKDPYKFCLLTEKNQTKELCEFIINIDPIHISLIKKQTEEIIHLTLKKDPSLYKLIDESQFPNLYKYYYLKTI
ncbi:MAG: hypothetical protein ACOC33_00645 [bacterium]